MTTQGHHEATRPYQLGIDVGSTTVKAVVLGLFRVECGWRHLGLLR